MNEPRPPNTPPPGDPPPAARRSTGAHVILLAGLNWSRYAVMLGVSLVMTPMLIGAMGLDLCGLYLFFYLVRCALQDLTQPLLTRELSAAWASRDSAQRRRAFSSAFAASLLGAGAALVLTLALVPFNAFLPRLPEGSEGSVRLLISAEGAMLVLMLGASPWVNYFIATHRVVENNFHRTFERVQDLLAALPALWLNASGDVAGFVLWYMAGRVALRVAHVAYCVVRVRRLDPDAGASLAHADRELMGHYSQAMGWSSSLPISNQFYWYIDQVLLNAYFGPVYNGVYAIINQLRGYIRILGGGLFMGAEAVTADLHERGAHDTNRRLLLGGMRSTAAITAFCAAVVCTFVGPLVHAWLGRKLESDAAMRAAALAPAEVVSLIWSFVLILAPAVIVIEAGCSAITFLFGMGMLRRFAPGLILMTVLKLVFSWGALAMAAGRGHGDILMVAWITSLTSIGMYGVYVPVLIRQAAGVGILEQYRRVYAAPLLSAAPVALAGWAVSAGLGPWNPGMTSMLKLAGWSVALGVLWLPIAAALIPEPGGERVRVLGMLDRLGARVAPVGLYAGFLRKRWNMGG